MSEKARSSITNKKTYNNTFFQTTEFYDLVEINLVHLSEQLD